MKSEASNSRGAKLDFIVIAGLLLSLALGLFTAFASPDLYQLLGVAVGLIGTAVTLQVDSILRLEKRFDAEDGRLRLLRAVEMQPDLLPDLTAIAETAAEALKIAKSPEFTAEVWNTVRLTRSSLTRLANGQLLTQDGNTMWMEQRAANVISSIQSTSFASDVEWWNSPGGDRYLTHNASAVRRGVTVERVFIVDEVVDQLGDILKAQFDAGVEVYLAHINRLPIELLRNIAIYDAEYLVEDVVNATGVVSGYRHTFNESDLADAQAAFARLRTLCTPYRPAVGGASDFRLS